jgi:hypothetical protein
VARDRLLSCLSLVFLSSGPALADSFSVAADATCSATWIRGRAIQMTISPTQMGVLRFDLGALPPGTSVEGAVLRLWPTHVLTEGSYDVLAVLEPWAETDTIVPRPPALGATYQSFRVNKAQLDTFVSVDVTDLVLEWTSGRLSNYGLAVVLSATGGGGMGAAAKENTANGHPPELEVFTTGSG